MMRIRRTVLVTSLVMVGALSLAACGAKSVSGSGSGNKGSTPSATGPIQIGVLITATQAAQAQSGVGKSATNPYHDSVHALIAAINAAGGIDGRKLEIVDDSIEFTDPNFDTDFEAICQKFTADNHVQAVLYDGTVYNQSFNSCLTNAGVPIFYGGVTGSPVGDTTDLSANPGLIAVNSVSLDHRVKSIMDKAIGAGLLTSGSKLGVIIEDCPYDTRTFDQVLKPIAASASVTVVKSDLKCAHGYSDNAPNLAALESTALRFKTEHVDSVMFLTLYENGLVYYLAQGAHTQKWTPQYLLFHSQGSSGAVALYPKDQLTKMYGFGGMPLIDVTNPPAPPAAQATVRQKCLSDAASQGVSPSSTVSQDTIFDACDVVRLLQRALTLSGGQGGTRALVAAVERIGTSFVSALDLNGATQFGPGRHDGLQLTQMASYQASCNCFSYNGTPGPIK